MAFNELTDEEIDQAIKAYTGASEQTAEGYLMDLMAIAPTLMGMPIAPLFRYRGVKKSEATKLAKAMKPVKGVYHEPFVGSGSSALRVGQTGKVKKMVLSDINPQITEYLQTLKASPEEVALNFRKFAQKIPASGHTTAENIPDLKRVWKNLQMGQYKGAEKAAAHLYLGNYSQVYMPGEIPSFNFGKYVKPETIAERIEKMGKVLQKTKAKILTRPWQESLKDVKTGDFINMDTPYLQTHKYPGTKHITTEEHKAMSEILESLSGETSGVIYNSPIGAQQFPWLQFEKTGLKRGEEMIGKWGELK